MNILVRNARPDYLISPERSNGQILQQDVTEERINSEIEVLRSKDVADAVVDPNWASVPAGQRTSEQVKAHEKAVLEYTRHLTVEPLRKSNVIHVAYLAGSPQQATATVERLLKEFLAKQRKSSGRPALRRFSPARPTATSSSWTRPSGSSPTTSRPGRSSRWARARRRLKAKSTRWTTRCARPRCS